MPEENDKLKVETSIQFKMSKQRSDAVVAVNEEEFSVHLIDNNSNVKTAHLHSRDEASVEQPISPKDINNNLMHSGTVEFADSKDRRRGGNRQTVVYCGKNGT